MSQKKKPVSVKDYTMKLHGMTSNYDELKATYQDDLHPLRKRRDLQMESAQEAGKTALYFSPIIATASYIFGKISDSMLDIYADNTSLITTSVGVGIGSAAFYAARMLKYKNNAKTIDQALVVLTGDTNEARFKSTSRILTRQGYLDKTATTEAPPVADASLKKTKPQF